MKKIVALVALVVGTGFWATSQVSETRREKDSRPLAPAEAMELASYAEGIRSADYKKRLRAVRGLATFNSLRAVPYLIQVLPDPSPEVVIAAVGALRDYRCRIGRTGNRRLIHLCAHSNKRIRNVARRALPVLADWRAAPLLLDEAANPECTFRPLIFLTLEYITGHSPSRATQDNRLAAAVGRIEAVLDDDVFGGGKISEEDVADLLAAWREWCAEYKDSTPVDWLMDDVKAGRADEAAAVKAFVRLRAVKAAPVIAGLLGSEDARVVGIAADAIRVFKDRGSVPALIEASLGAEGKAWRRISRALGGLCVRGDAALLLGALRKCHGKRFVFYNDSLERLSAAQCPVEREEFTDRRDEIIAFWDEWLGRTGKLSDAEVWGGALRSGSARDRMRAVHNLRTLGDVAVPLLIAALGDETEGIRRLADKSLRATTFYSVDIDPFAPEKERAAAIEKWREWWRWGARLKPVERLTAVVQDRGETVRHRADAARGLGALGEWRAVPHLIAALDEAPFGLRHYAGGALVSLTGRSFRKPDDACELEPSDEWRKWWKSFRGKTKENVLLLTIGDIAEDEGVKLKAITLLAEMRSKRAIPCFVNLLDDDSYLVSVAAEEALETVSGNAFFYGCDLMDDDRLSVRKKWLLWAVAQRDCMGK